MITINFTGNINNDSLQIGDMAYFVTPIPLSGFAQSTIAPSFIGSVEGITGTSIIVNETIQTATPPLLPGPNDFIMFAKDSEANLSGLVGYYAEIEIKNDSTEKAEMFSISSEVTPSSK